MRVGKIWPAAPQIEMHPHASVYSKLTIGLGEHQFREDRDGYRWEGEFWFGDVIKKKGEPTGRGEAAYTHPISDPTVAPELDCSAQDMPGHALVPACLQLNSSYDCARS